VIHIG